MKLELTPRTERTHRTVFQERYEWLFGWALKLTRGDRAEAEDILHDSFIQFVRLAPGLSAIDNIDAYLNRMVRNLHLSRVMRRARVPMVHLDALDYDSVHLSVDAVDPFKMVPLQLQLHAICDWGCARRAKTKAASILLLRYFLNYCPSEIGKLGVCNRQVIEKSLQLARREMRAEHIGVESGDKASRWTVSGRGQAAHFPLRFATPDLMRTMDSVALEFSLRSKLFSNPVGECISIFDMERLYEVSGGTSTPLESKVLAHLTSCQACLDRANRYLQLPSLEERSAMESRGGDHPKSPGSPSTAVRMMPRGERSIKRLYEHRPTQLTVQVDAGRRTSMVIQAPENHLDVELGRSRTASFIEVFSEQGVQLMYLPVLTPDEGGEYLQESIAELSEDRQLRLQILFSQPRPTIALSYVDPLFREINESPDADASAPELRPAPARLAPQQQSWIARTAHATLNRLCDWAMLPFRSVPRAVSFVTALLLIVILPFVQTKQTTAEAETLLTRADAWQRSVTTGNASVLHRSFDYFELPNKPTSALKQATHQRVEVWREPANGRKLTRVFDDAGNLLYTADGSVTGQIDGANAWRFDPSVDNFRIAAATAAGQVSRTATGYEIQTPIAELYLDRESYRPVRAIFRLADRNVEFNERSTETVSEALTPLAAAHLSAATSPANSQPPDLDVAEIMARTKLHDLQADLGEDIQLARTAKGIQIAGIVTPESRRLQLTEALRSLPGVTVTLRTPDEANSLTHHQGTRVVDATEDANGAPLLESWLKSRYQDDEQRSIAVQYVLTRADQCIFRAHALDQLAKRYGDFNDASIHAMARDHAMALKQAASSVDQWLAEAGPAEGSAAGPPVADSTLSPLSRAEALVRVSQDLERGLADLVAARAGEQSPDPSQAAAVLARCRRDIHQLMELSENIQ